MRLATCLLALAAPLLVAAQLPPLNFPKELVQYTGLSEDAIRKILDARSIDAGGSAINSSACVPATTFPAATGSSDYDRVRRNEFVKREGSKLTLGGQPFKMVGGNIYWLGLDENVVPNPSYPSKRRVLEMFGVVSAMRGTTIRTHTLAVTIGMPLGVEPSLDVFNEAAYEPIDFAIAVARIYGIKLLIPLTDNYNYYHGGKYQYIAWAGIKFSGTGANITPAGVGAYFYNTTAIVDSFKRFITHHLNHVNQYTGIAYKDDPIILGWESGNELSAARFGEGPAPPAWTKQIGEHVKSLAPNHLFVDGSYGIFPETGQLNVSVVDVFTDHFYPPNITKFNNGYRLVTGAGRHYLAGEYDWKAGSSGDDLASWLRAIENVDSAGTFLWSYFGRDDTCCQYVEHNDGLSFYYKRNTTYNSRGDILTQHAMAMGGRQVPAVVPELGCSASNLPSRFYM